ncbi:hypothetical protein BLA50215_06811 [Burkholderia lata]|uniref:hypothetical protein n=1 Tax=Burkholderia lata (strain ATCC 17760 / DSM 23089 / LMG 22485 / NCIMB 9086 / R18194 / 383) TaxID=482957 RepID=UPI00145372E2|nr:hypothetical protein [Burkholderia lata]VWD56776.1 hypothetical protein BLA50215_06811 [Burkholderia lata]
MKAPANEMLVLDIAGHVAVVVTDVAAVAGVLMRLGFARHGDRWERTIMIDALSLPRLSTWTRCFPLAVTGALKPSSSITGKLASFETITVRSHGAGQRNT